jgi:hypothetical protein
MTKSEITIKMCWDNLGVIPSTFRKIGITLERRGDDIYIRLNGNEIKQILTVLFLPLQMHLGLDLLLIY